MKVLGITEGGEGYYKERAYIVQITHDEICKVANKSAYHKEIKDLQLGEEYPIADGYDFRKEIVEAVRQMQSAHERFAAAAATMTRFAKLVTTADEASS
jgi:hypothetical protein